MPYSSGDVDLHGGPGTDTVLGDAAANGLDGGSGNDSILGGGGGDSVHGGPGFDAMSYADRAEGVRVTLDGVADDGSPGEGDDVFPDVEALYGTNGDDELRASGGPVNVTLVGAGGDDVLAGGPGNDELIGGAGADTLSGGIGEDRADYLDHQGPVTVTLDGQRNDGSAGEDDWVMADVEDVGGSRYDDTIVGNDRANVLDGSEGDDALAAVDGVADQVDCGDGSDRASVDAIDVLTGCEAVAVTTPPAAPAPAPPPPPTQPVPPTPPRLRP